jgi:hypothetical protein
MPLYENDEEMIPQEPGSGSGSISSASPADTPEGFEQFVIQKIGFNPYQLNPIYEAMNHFAQNENSYFKQVFGGQSPQDLTPDMLKHWNEQKKYAIESVASSLDMQRQQGVEKLKIMMQMKKEYDQTKREEQEITSRQTINPITGQKVYTTKTGKPTNTVVPPAAPSEQERKDIKQEMTILKMTKDVDQLFKNDYVGPVAGRYGQLAEKFTNLPEDQVKFYATIRDINDFVLRVRSGAQINEQEYKRLTSFLMDANLPPDNFKARLERFSENIDWILGLERKIAAASNKTTQAELTPPPTGAKTATGKKGKFTIIKVK